LEKGNKPLGEEKSLHTCNERQVGEIAKAGAEVDEQPARGNGSNELPY